MYYNLVFIPRVTLRVLKLGLTKDFLFLDTCLIDCWNVNQQVEYVSRLRSKLDNIISTSILKLEFFYYLEVSVLVIMLMWIFALKSFLKSESFVQRAKSFIQCATVLVFQSLSSISINSWIPEFVQLFLYLPLLYVVQLPLQLSWWDIIRYGNVREYCTR